MKFSGISLNIRKKWVNLTKYIKKIEILDKSDKSFLKTLISEIIAYGVIFNFICWHFFGLIFNFYSWLAYGLLAVMTDRYIINVIKKLWSKK